MHKVEFKFNNGEQVRDIVTGFTGTIISMSKHINNCLQYGVRPRMIVEDGKQGKYPEMSWFDEDEVEIVPEGEQVVMPPKIRPTGGPRDNQQL